MTTPAVSSFVVHDHDEKYFQTMLAKIRSNLTPHIPSIDKGCKQILQSALASVVAAETTRDACQKAQDAATTNAEKEATQKALAQAESALAQATDVALKASIPILASLEHTLLRNDSLDPLLTKGSILANATKQLAGFCKLGMKETKQIDDLLGNANLMRDMLYNGGAKGGNYGQAMQVYTAIMEVIASKEQDNVDNDDDDDLLVLSRLAMATSLELAVPLNEFDTNVPINPIERFRHYQHALVENELDATVLRQSTWSCRYIINCDAPNDQLSWGRCMLRNYRPDILQWHDYKWRYVYIVRTDVPYCDPQWTSKPRSYPQIISGGGKCGPRAWFGRFALRAFGIPTWGVRQPGHAALGHWTPDEGWVMCLGAAWKFSTWEGREGLDFCLEAQARQHGGRDYYMGVCRLEWVADALGEVPIRGRLNPDSFWQSLALLQKRHLANRSFTRVVNSTKTMLECTKEGALDDKSRSTIADDTTLHTRVDPCRIVNDSDPCRIVNDNGTIHVPATSCSKPTRGTKNAIFMKSFSGGTQLHIRDDQSIEYKITLQEANKYRMTIRLVTVHLKTKPLLLTVSTDNAVDDEDDTQDCVVAIESILIPYTVGEWSTTDPVEIDLGRGTNVLTLTRETPNFGLTLKELAFTPV